MPDTMSRIFAVIKDRQANPKQGSYTNYLLDVGIEQIVKKVGEEAIEIIVAATTQSNDRLVSEMADLAYHCLVLLAARGLSPEDVSNELERRCNP
jgi:phosphoribosyl-ATP pyrophosphohydrolase